MFIFLAIVGLSVLVFFHELGHFIMAKILGVRVEEFGFGYPPRMIGMVLPQKNKPKFFFGKKIPQQYKDQTIYSLNWIPFGGFNKLKGELDSDADKDSFFQAAWWKKALIGLGGIGMNIILAVFIFSVLYFTGIPKDIDSIEKGGKILRPVGIQIGMVAKDSPADKEGFKMGDIIMDIDGYYFDNVEDIQEHIKTRIGESVALSIKRGKETISHSVEVLPYNQVFSSSLDQVLDEGGDKAHGVIGIALSNTVIVAYPIYQAVFMGFKTSILLLGRLFYGIWLIFKILFSQQKMLGDLFGPVGITVMTAEIARAGYIYFLQFVAFLSVAIGAFQMIPFPALDGSRILFAFIQGVKGRPVNPRTESVIISIGFYLLLMLLFFITFREIIGLF